METLDLSFGLNELSFGLAHDSRWAIDASVARVLLAQLKHVDFSAHKAEFVSTLKADTPDAEARGRGGEAEDKPYDMYGSVAVINLSGAMMRAVPSMKSGCSTVAVRKQLRAASNDPDVKAVLLQINSPGGTVDGTEELAEDVARLSAKKNCVVHAGMACSAAYWVASQASAIYANKTSMIGSIGTYMVAEDWSRFYRNAGVEVFVVSTGKFKGAGVEGAPLTEEHLAYFQETVDDLNEHFLSSVCQGRDIARATLSQYADGRTWDGVKALKFGLIDGIASFDEVLLSLQQAPARKAIAAKPTNFTAENPMPIVGPLGIALDSVLTAVRGARDGVSSVSPRITDVRDIRESQSRVFSPDRLAQVVETHEELLALCQEFGKIRESCEHLGIATEPEPAEEAVETATASPLSADLEGLRAVLDASRETAA